MVYGFYLIFFPYVWGYHVSDYILTVFLRIFHKFVRVFIQWDLFSSSYRVLLGTNLLSDANFLYPVHESL